MTFSNQQVSNVTARQIQKDLDWAKKEYDKGNTTPLLSLRAAHIGNGVVERFAQQVIKDKSDADYKAWIPQEVWH